MTASMNPQSAMARDVRPAARPLLFVACDAIERLGRSREIPVEAEVEIELMRTAPFVSLAVMALLVGAEACLIFRPTTQSVDEQSASYEQAQVEHVAAAHLEATTARFHALRREWKRTHRVIDESLLRRSADIESRLESATACFTLVEYADREDVDVLRGAMLPMLDDLDRRIDLLRLDSLA